MKKRFKLITTIASLCLAVALMAFGVYAAGTATFNVTSNVSFSVDGNLAGTLVVKSYSLATNAISGSPVETSEEVEIKAETQTVTGTIELTQVIQLSVANPYVGYEVIFTPNAGTNKATVKLTTINIVASAEGAETVWAEVNTAAALTGADNAISFTAKYVDSVNSAANVPVNFTVSLTAQSGTTQA